MLDALLAVIIGLLGVAVVIALIGVANTLSLSVLERRRENALLRALGLTRRQLRSTLAIEGVLLAVVGAVVGLVLGLLYGWIGAFLMLGSTTGMGLSALTVPWGAVLAVLAVAVTAGVLASVLPARGAARIPRWRPSPPTEGQAPHRRGRPARYQPGRPARYRPHPQLRMRVAALSAR
ncbi:FtsX-like permease family protein [Litorihabitans aurantiacus]|uniref:ABC3 transporter permease C-terminal domain-containing protein n=1 Tax=Litorihabitans aurantiacus TaxID=1930061 RepID=A0AA37XGX4_9MICO|nr:ABC transporter permease [Litorihabitans aurantiacus]GMA33062.1 hypothetical protein GCM10025875_30540 [Litorihabitans aurantiacus]